MQHLIEIVNRFSNPKVALVGDFMLDRYVYGDTERVSAEAPVPVLKVIRSESRIGGAGNVAAAILALGGEVTCIGVSGKDKAGEELTVMLRSAGAQTVSLLHLDGRATSVKTRYIGLSQHKNAQQMVRVDEEVTEALSTAAQRTVRAAVRSQTANCPVLALQDHNKGVLSDSNVPEIIADARKAGCKVIVDPALISDYRRYRGATLLTPNRYEASLASGVEIAGADTSALERAGRQILMTTDAETVMITLDRDGIFLLERDGSGQTFPARPRSVADGTGAGDAVLATMAVAIGSGCDYADALALANVAGGLEVERFGVVPISRAEILDELHRMLGLRGGKVLARKRLAREIIRRRSGGETIVFTNGCFDLLHAGHVRYLRQARELGSCLIIAINSDDSVRRLKGPSRPVIGADERAEMLGALECVDYVTIFDEDTPEPLLELLKPDILAKGGTTPVVVGAELVETYGGKVLTLDRVEGASTTEIINRIVDTGER